MIQESCLFYNLCAKWKQQTTKQAFTGQSKPAGQLISM